MKNNLCQCDGAGWCDRHQREKTGRQFEICQGNCRRSLFWLHWNFWENGQRSQSSATKPAGASRGSAKRSDGAPSATRRAGCAGCGGKQGRNGHDLLELLPCVHRGDQTREVETTGCAAPLAAEPVFACAVHGECTLRKTHCTTREQLVGCLACKDRKPTDAPRRNGRRRERSRLIEQGPPVEPISLENATRHVIFHVWPTQNGAWEWNCDRLEENASLFNGRRIVGIVEGDGSQPADVVKERLKSFTDEFIVARNSAKLWELQTWTPAMERLEDVNGPQDVTFRCHAKGVSHSELRPDAKGITIYRWTGAMWETCCDWKSVRPLLEKHGAVGSFRRRGKARPKLRCNGFCDWHYSGTFFWWRNQDVFRRKWRNLPNSFYGVEAWPGWMFRHEESGVIVGDNVGNLYDFRYFVEEIEPQLEAWRKERVH